jgi:glycosyltransferase involved in cell wall biosynthesis
VSSARILINALGIAQAGGSRSYIRNVLAELSDDDRGFRFALLSFPGQFDDADTSGVDIEVVKLPQHVPGSSGSVWRVLYEESILPFRARRFDSLFCQGDLWPFFGWTPTAVLLRNMNIYDRRWYPGVRTATLARLASLGVRHSTRVLFPTRSAATEVSRLIHVPPERIRVVSYGISLAAFEEGKIDAPGGLPPYLFLPAAPERHKNIEVLIDCVPHLADSKMEVRIAGISHLNPDHQGMLEERARALGVGERVHFLGAVPYRQVLQHYRSAAALVFPSFIESFGHPILEAMAAGTPIVASDIPTFHENAADCALFFPPTDPVMLARTVDRLAAEPEATLDRVNRGHARAADLSWKKHVDGLCEVLDEIRRRPS